MRLILSLSLALAAAAGWAAEVYMAVAPDGTVIYSDRPFAPDARPVGVDVTRASSSAANAAMGRPSSASSPDSSSPSRADAEPQGDEPRTSAEQRERNCEIARERVTRYSGARRLFRELPDGEREYLEDDEIDEVRAKAQADVEAWCS